MIRALQEAFFSYSFLRLFKILVVVLLSLCKFTGEELIAIPIRMSRALNESGLIQALLEIPKALCELTFCLIFETVRFAYKFVLEVFKTLGSLVRPE